MAPRTSGRGTSHLWLATLYGRGARHHTDTAEGREVTPGRPGASVHAGALCGGGGQGWGCADCGAHCCQLRKGEGGRSPGMPVVSTSGEGHTQQLEWKHSPRSTTPGNGSSEQGHTLSPATSGKEQRL